jgi:hypothetical protein
MPGAWKSKPEGKAERGANDDGGWSSGGDRAVDRAERAGSSAHRWPAGRAAPRGAAHPQAPAHPGERHRLVRRRPRGRLRVPAPAAGDRRGQRGRRSSAVLSPRADTADRARHLPRSPDGLHRLLRAGAARRPQRTSERAGGHRRPKRRACRPRRRSGHLRAAPEVAPGLQRAHHLHDGAAAAHRHRLPPCCSRSRWVCTSCSPTAA